MTPRTAADTDWAAAGSPIAAVLTVAFGTAESHPKGARARLARRDRFDDGQQRTRGAGWLLSFVQSGHVVPARSRHCSYWRPTVDCHDCINAGHRVGLNGRRTTPSARPGFVANRWGDPDGHQRGVSMAACGIPHWPLSSRAGARSGRRLGRLRRRRSPRSLGRAVAFRGLRLSCRLGAAGTPRVGLFVCRRSSPQS
jgi:hypothetical protein